MYGEIYSEDNFSGACMFHRWTRKYIVSCLYLHGKVRQLLGPCGTEG